MKGLLKNNYFATLDNAKAITALMVLLCALGIVMKNQMLLISFTLFCICLLYTSPSPRDS